MDVADRMLVLATTLGLTLCLSREARARDPFQVTLDVENAVGSRAYSDITRAIDVLSATRNLQTLVPTYTDISPARVTVNLRGLATTGTFAAGSPVLRVSIPLAGVDRPFNGRTREESGRLFVQWLETSNKAVLRAAVANTCDPVAGCPASAANAAATSGFDQAFADAIAPSNGGAGIDARFSSLSAAGYGSNALELPLNYAWKLSPRDTLQVDLPVGFSEIQGGRSYTARLGVLWRRRMTSNWTLQPSASFGAIGSVDLGAGAGIWTIALTSTLNLDLPAGWQATVANGISYVSTIPISVGRYSLAYNISNVVFRNGIVASHNLGFRLANRPVRGGLFAIDTRYTGDAVYVDNYQELGAFLAVGGLNPIRFGVSYLTGARGVRGFSVNAGARF